MLHHFYPRRALWCSVCERAALRALLAVLLLCGAALLVLVLFAAVIAAITYDWIMGSRAKEIQANHS